MALIATSGNVSLSKGRSRRPMPATKPSCWTTTSALSPVRSVVRGSTTKTSATRSNASRRRSRTRTAVARAVARAAPTRTVARASPRALAKAQNSAKMDKEALSASLTGTRTQTSPEGSPILHQGGTLSPLVGSQIRGLRPVPRRKPNKNKKLSVPTKMGTGLTPANIPASCVWYESCRGRGLK